MTVAYCVNDLSDGFSGILLRESADFNDFVKELSSLHQFHHKADVFITLKSVNQLHNVWVIKLFEDINF